MKIFLKMSKNKVDRTEQQVASWKITDTKLYIKAPSFVNYVHYYIKEYAPSEKI